MKLISIPATRMAARIYLVILVAFLAIAALLVASVRLRSDWRWRRALGLAPELNSLVANHAPNSPALNSKLKDVQRETGAEITIYSKSGQLLGTSARHAPPPISERHVGRFDEPPRPELADAPPPPPHAPPPPPGSPPLAGPPGPPPRHVLPLSVPNSPGAYAIVRVPKGFPPPAAPVAEIAVALVCLALASVALTIMLARPLNRIASAARTFGAGDLTARAHLDQRDELGQLARTFDEMADRVTQLLSAQREMLAGVSHEIRTPLARMRVALDLASEGDAATAQQSLGDIAQDLGELDQMVEDVLVMARLEAQSTRAIPPLRREPIAAREIVDRALAHFSAAHPARAVDTDLSGEAINIHGDGKLLRRVLENLLENAHKYSPAESRIRVALAPDDSTACFSVTDQGQGIAAEDLPHVFRPFFRADRSRNRGTGGVGLGLALAKRIVEAHSGHIGITSELDRGTTVTFHIPRREQSDDSGSELGAQSAGIVN